MAPEVILSGDVDHQEYDARADVWFVTQIVLTIVTIMMMIHDAPKFFFLDSRSVGICLLELAEGHPPLSHLHPMRALMQVGLKN